MPALNVPSVILGIAIAARVPRINTTIISSTKVKACLFSSFIVTNQLKKKKMAETLANEIVLASDMNMESFALGKKNEAEKQADSAR